MTLSPWPTGTDRLLKIGDFARLAGTNLRTLRYYEELGLLAPATRSDGGFRYYRPTDLNRLEMIKDLQELGLPLERIREVMGARTVGDEPCDRSAMMGRVRAALEEQDRLIAERIAQLGAQREKLAAAGRKLLECESCPHSPAPHNNFCEPCPATGQPLPADLSALF
jgi:DNA-binding transcriptional MerR regulator